MSVHPLTRSGTSLLVLALCVSAGLAACGKPSEPAAPPVPITKTYPGVELVDGGLVWAINGAQICYPGSESLDWSTMDAGHPVNEAWLESARALLPAAYRPERLVPQRWTRLGQYTLICAFYDPPVPDGGHNWVVESATGAYVGHFLDHNSR